MRNRSKFYKIAINSTPQQLFYFIAGILVLEFTTMLIIDLMPPLPTVVTALIDCGIMSVVLAPAVYFFSIRPYKRYQIEQKRSSAALKVSEDRLRAITFNAPDLIMEVDKDGRILFISRELPDFRIKNAYGKNLYDWASPESHAEMKEKLAQVFTDGLTQYFQSSARGVNGESRWYLNSLSAVNAGDVIEKAILIASDITELILSEQQRIDILQTAMDGFWVLDNQGRILDVNDRYCQMSGYSKEELIAMSISDMEVNENSDEVLTHINKVIQLGLDHFESRHQRKDGSFFDVEISSQYQPLKKQFIAFIHDITDRKRFEEDLKYHAGLIESISDAIISTDENFCIKSWNQSAEMIYGWNEDEVIGKPTADILQTTFLNNTSREESIRLLQSKNIWQDEVIHKRKDNTSVNILASVKLLTDKNGDFIGAVAVNRDITEQKKAEAQLLESEKRYTSLFKGNQSVMLLIEPDTGEIKDANPAACRYYGWTHQEICSKNIAEINALPKEEITVELQRAKEEQRNHFHFKHRLANGEVRDVESFSCPITFDDSTLLYSIIHDITESKQSQDALKESEIFLNKAQEIAHLGSWSLDLINNKLTWSKEACLIFGFQEHEFLQNYEVFLGVVHPDDVEKVNSAYMSSIMEGKDSYEVDHRIIRKNSGEVRYLLEKCEHIRNNSGEIVRSVGMTLDITEQKQSAEALRENERLLRESQSAAHIGSYSADLINKTWKASPEMYEIFGVDETCSNSTDLWVESIHPDFKEELTREIFENENKKDTFEHEYKIIRFNDGAERWVQGLGKFQYDHQMSPVRLIGTIQDITERKIREETLRKLSQILVALGKSSQALSKSVDETSYLKHVCKIVVSETDFSMAWIGFAEDDEEKSVRMVASAGFNDNYLETIRLSWGDNVYGHGPTGTAIRTGNTSICNNMLTDPDFEPWREQALQRGYASSIVFPLKTVNKTFGALSIYSKKTDSFLADEIKLLSKLANDLANGITTIRLRAAHKLAEEELSKSHSKLEELVKTRTRELQFANDLLKQELSRRAEQQKKLRLAEEKYRTVADFTHDWEFWINADGEYNYISPSCERISGYKAEEFIQNPELIFEIIHPEDLKAFKSHQQTTAFENLCHRQNQFRIIRRDGAIRWIEIQRHSIYDKSGNFMGIRGSKKDITERKKIEQLLKVSNRKYFLLSENITDGIFICRSGRLDYANRAMGHIFGYQIRDLVGMNLSQLVQPEYSAELDFIYNAEVPVNKKKNVEIECFRKDNSIILVEFIFNYVEKEGLVYGVAHDITEKKQAQKNMVKAIILTEEKERTNFSKELHDGLGPLLSTIKLYIQWSERSKKEQSRKEIIENAEMVIEEAIQAVKEISNRLSPHLLVNYGLASAIQNFVNKLEGTSAIHIELDCNLNRRLGDEIEAAVYRAVIECVNNTLKHSGAKNVSISLNDTGEQLRIRYQDDGVGFDIGKTISEKKGLGLFNLQNRIQNIGGKINLFSEPGAGVDYQIIVNL